MSEEKKTQKKERKKEKKRQKRQREEDEVVETAQDDTTTTKPGSPKKKKDPAKTEARHRRRRERQALLEQVPQCDEHGIPYTKQQLRRMRKRVQRGLHPIETPAETHARRERDAALRREEEAELAGLTLAEKKKPPPSARWDEGADSDDNDDDVQVSEEQEDDAAEPESETDDAFAYEKKKESSSSLQQQQQQQQPPARKKKKRSKELPSDYVCSACQNQHQPAHWIYDCPDKRTVRGTNQKKKHARGLHNPSDCKLFVSGLPFEAKAQDVVQIFQSESSRPISVQHCKLLKFADTGRCKGQAYLTFGSPEDAQQALKLNGTTIPSNITPPPVSSGKAADISREQQPKRKELKLQVTKVLNRFQTKKQKAASATWP